MSEIATLWQLRARKEVMDLLQQLWPTLDLNGRYRLSEAITFGPPAHMLEHIDEDDRGRLRDRMIFDRIIILERAECAALPELLQVEMARIRTAYPNWGATEGEQAHFGTWSEMRWGPDTNYRLDDLKALEDDALLEVLLGENDKREGLLDTWRQFALAEPKRAIVILETLAAGDERGATDIWRCGLWGLRDAQDAGQIIERVVKLLGDMPDDLVAQPEFLRAAADILDSAGNGAKGTKWQPAYWTLFDRTLAVASNDRENLVNNLEQNNPVNTDWVSFAINCSMGKLAGAFFNAMFARRLHVGQGIPEDLRFRLDALMATGQLAHRPARVIAATRISYLYAVDQEWTAQRLLPSFQWDDEEESVAVWQAFAHQARIDAQLWAAIKPSYLALFTMERLERLRPWGRNISQIFMLVGVELGFGELPRDDARNIIRAMSDEMRRDAAAWLASYLQQQKGDKNGDPDKAWRDRVAPWLKRVWPPEPAMQSPGVSDQLARVAIATDKVFAEAIATIRPYLMPAQGSQVVHELNESVHPDSHPIMTLELIDATVKAASVRFNIDEMRMILDRVVAGDAAIVDHHRYRRWRDEVERNAR